MRKNLVLLVAPLMLLSCQHEYKVTYTVTFNCQNCKAYGEDDKEITNSVISIFKSSTTQTLYQKFHFGGDRLFKPPLRSAISVKKTKTDEAIEYEYNKGEIIVPIIDDLTISAEGTDTKDKTLEEFTWNEISAISASGQADKFFNVGDTKTVEVNGLSHKVRIIGFNEDEDRYGNSIGITFEFANLISDSDGNSLATQWNDTNDKLGASNNYLNSSIRYTLNKKGNSNHILWAKKNDMAWSTDASYADKSILEMLPGELTKVLIPPKKSVLCFNNKLDAWVDTDIKDEETGEYDSLFLLSDIEIGNSTDRMGAYSFYRNSFGDKLNLLRVKKQTNEKDFHTNFTMIPVGVGQTYSGVVVNYAGYNYKSDESGGGLAWLRTPGTEIDGSAWHVEPDGTLISVLAAYIGAIGVAPGFCV